MSDSIHKSHNKSLLLYHFVYPIKYSRSVYYVNTVGQDANEEVIKRYLQNQGKDEYEKLYTNQFRLF